MDIRGSSFKNFRDMGALVCEGGVIKRGKLFRACALRAKTRADRRFLDSLGLDAIVDLRTPEEVAEKPDYIPLGCEYVHAPAYDFEQFDYITSTRASVREVFKLKGAEADALRENKLLLYAFLPFARRGFEPLFERMDEGKTIAFHCSEGKDRTGVAAALIELALGRGESEARAEYMRSNAELERRNRAQRALLKLIGTDARLLENITYSERTHDELFDAALGAVRSKYADVSEFLAAEHGVTPQRAALWRRHYLAPPEGGAIRLEADY